MGMIYNIGVNMVTLVKKRFWEDLINNSSRIIYHMVVATLSAAIALSLPLIMSFIAKNILVYWSIIGNEKIFVISIEMALAILLTLFFNYMGRSWKDRKLSNMARNAGLVFVITTKGLLSRRRIKKWKEKQGFAKDVMVMGSTGFRTFVDSKGDLHNVIRSCREAKIMLLNPFSEAASARAKSIPGPDISPESFREQIKKSIVFLKDINGVKKNIKLKLYADTPLHKLAILDDCLWIQHYHTGLDIQVMPEYVFKHDQNLGSLYIPFYQYFLTKWNDPNTPEYDLESDELIFRDTAGNEVRREKFNGTETETEVASNTDFNNHSVSKNGTLKEKGIHPFSQSYRTHVGIENLYKNIW